MRNIDLKVLGLSEFSRTDPQFYANTISEHLKSSHLHIEKPHKHNFFAAFLFTHGSGIHEIDFSSYDVKPGAVFLLSPGQAHNWRLSDDVDGILYFHSQEFYESNYIYDPLYNYSFFSNISSRSALYLNKNRMIEIRALFKKILINHDAVLPKRNQLVLSLITQIYIEFERMMIGDILEDINTQNSYYSRFLEFRSLVEIHYKIQKSAAAYAELMHMSARHLNRINKQIINKTTSEIITERVILEAKRMLLYSKANFSEIADDLGFADYAHFSKVFKNGTGQTPTQFSKLYP
ncbi:MAG TPA: helix-turn-helix transcriptional regulator [Flavobacterium sp.]|jgi:AraC-like DNA-binding protein